MARRAKHHDEELPFVALMDTMTNVVGVLIIVLVMIGIGLAKTVKKILSDLPMVTAEEHAELKSEVAQFDGKRDPAEVDAEIKKLEEELPKIVEKLKALENEQDKNPVMADLQKLLKELEAARKEREQRKLTTDQLLAEIDKLKLKLDTTPTYQPPPPIAVRLPNTRPMPDKAQLQRVFVTEGKVMFVRNDEFQKLVEDELKTGNSQYLVRTETQKDANGRVVLKQGKPGQASVQKKLYFDATKLSAFFERSKIGNRDIKVDVAQVPNSPNIQIKLTPRPTGGETIEQARKVNSAFRTQLHNLKTDPKSVVWFYVSKDSIPAYLGARDIVDLEGLPVGWEIYEKPTFAQNVAPDYLVEFTPPPPPPPPPGGAPPPKPAGPPPVTIAAPKMTVD